MVSFLFWFSLQVDLLLKVLRYYFYKQLLNMADIWCDCSTCRTNRMEKSIGENVDTSASESGDVIIVNNKMVKEYCCEKCNRQFAYAKSYNRHEIECTGTESFSCRICDQLFTHDSNRMRHEVEHSKEKNFQCGKCDKRFACSINRIQHELCIRL